MMYDAVIIGGGFYGCAIAMHLARRGMRQLLLAERTADLLTCASHANQARVHNGYHYPRSFVTAYRSRVNLPNFCRDYADAVCRDDISLYAIARHNSKVAPAQFERFMRDIGAPYAYAEEELLKLFEPRLIAAAYLTREYVFDAGVLRAHFHRALGEANVGLALNTQAVLQAADNRVTVRLEHAQGSRQVQAKYVFNCTYAAFNHVLGPIACDSLTPLKHEVTELVLIDPPQALQQINITVMDGPFFSLTRFPNGGCHCLSHVRYTPHEAYVDEDGSRAPREALDEAAKHSRAHFMLADSARYLPCLREARVRRSLFEIKTVLLRRETDDGRPILFRREARYANLYSVLGGKIDNIYDILARLDAELA